MNANEWQSVADVGSLSLAVVGFVAGIIYALLRGRFVTRQEHTKTHDALHKRVGLVEADLEKKINRDELKAFTSRVESCERGLSNVESKLAETNGLLKGNIDASKALGHQLNILIAAGLKEAG